MKEKLQHALAVLLEKLGNVSAALSAQQKVVAKQHTIWGRALKKAATFEKVADQRRQHASDKSLPKAERQRQRQAATRFDNKAQKQHRKAEDAKLRAQPSIHEAKRLARRVHGLEQDAAEVKAEQKKLAGNGKVKLKGNKATGGSTRERVIVVALASISACMRGARTNRYSQPGTWDVDHPITGERSGARSDCSQWEISVAKGAGAPDPADTNFSYGNTATILTGSKAITRTALLPGDHIIYGDGGGFHTELYLGDGHPNHSFGQTGNPRTGGHGSPPIDFGIVDLIPGVTTRYRRSIHD